jgi:hypothetical protein
MPISFAPLAITLDPRPIAKPQPLSTFHGRMLVRQIDRRDLLITDRSAPGVTRALIGRREIGLARRPAHFVTGADQPGIAVNHDETIARATVWANAIPPGHRLTYLLLVMASAPSNASPASAGAQETTPPEFGLRPRRNFSVENGAINHLRCYEQAA